MFLILSILLTVVNSILSVESNVGGMNAIVDLSHWNGNVNLTLAKEDGIFGVIHKATQGISYIDPKYAARKIEADKNGMSWAAYHFADGSSGEKQANHFLKVVGEDPDVLLAIDIEENPSGPSANLSIAEDIVRIVYEARGRYPLVYGSAFLKDMVKGKKSFLLDCPLWIAQWGPKPIIPDNTWSNWTLWQYTDGQNGPEPHSVNGIGKCDRDTINTSIHPNVESMWKTAGYKDANKHGTRQTTTPQTTSKSNPEPTTPRPSTARPSARVTTPRNS